MNESSDSKTDITFELRTVENFRKSVKEKMVLFTLGVGKFGFGSIRSDLRLFRLVKKSSDYNPNLKPIRIRSEYYIRIGWIIRINSDSRIGNIILKLDLSLLK